MAFLSHIVDIFEVSFLTDVLGALIRVRISNCSSRTHVKVCCNLYKNAIAFGLSNKDIRHIFYSSFEAS